MEHPLVDFFKLYFFTHFYPNNVYSAITRELRDANTVAGTLHGRFWHWNAETFQYEISNDYCARHIHTVFNVEFVVPKKYYVKLTATVNKKITHWDLYSFDELFLLGLSLKAPQIRVLEEQAIVHV